MIVYWKHLIRITTGLAIFTFLALLTIASRPASASLDFIMPTPNATQDSWIIINLPADATQLMRGAEVYRLVCNPCHAPDGTGLTDQWRATWDEKDQNCWQSKCHAANHPPEGFMLPMSPPIVGPSIPARFKTAMDLHNFIQTYMPWYNPNSIADEKAWAVTAYVMKLNGITPPDNLSPLNADKIPIFSTITINPALTLSIPPNSQGKKPAPTQADTPNFATPTPGNSTQKSLPEDWLPILVVITVVIILLILLAARLLMKKS
jgi:mono/diheme cytochrome c family protein